MERLYILIILLLSGNIFLIICLVRYEIQMRHVLKELYMAEQSDTNILLTSALPIGKTEAVIAAFNHMLEKNQDIRERLLRENRSYRESITGISHDIRTPLTSAKGYVQMMRDAGVTEDKKEEYAGIIERRLDDLSGMLDQLFLYARIEAGELSLAMEVCNAGNLFAETISLFYKDFLQKKDEPIVRIAQGPCRIYADRQAFVRIVENLIKNALIHGTGGYELSLQQENGEAVIHISNETESIFEEDMERIFDRFYTTDISRSRKMTGLGLAIVKELAGQMHGQAKAWLKDGVFSIEVRFPSVPDRDIIQM